MNAQTKNIVFTGPAKVAGKRINRDTLIAAANKAGFTVRQTVTPRTDMIVASNFTHKSTKLEKARELKAAGADIKMVQMGTFLSDLEFDIPENPEVDPEIPASIEGDEVTIEPPTNLSDLIPDAQD